MASRIKDKYLTDNLPPSTSLTVEDWDKVNHAPQQLTDKMGHEMHVRDESDKSEPNDHLERIAKMGFGDIAAIGNAFEQEYAERNGVTPAKMLGKGTNMPRITQRASPGGEGARWTPGSQRQLTTSSASASEPSGRRKTKGPKK